MQGYEFEAAVVARALALDAAEVEEKLGRLERVHAFVRLVDEHEFPDRTLTLRYRFVHVLYQNALYASLRPTRRASVSAAVARAATRLLRGEKAALEVAGELGLLLWEAARDFARAADCFLQAAQNATRLFANQEAVVLASRGLKLLEALPDTPERARQELALLIALGPLLIATKGWMEPEVERIYTRAQALCQQVGETPQLFPALWGLWFFYIGHSDRQTARNLGERLLSLAQRTQDPALLLQAHHALGPTYFLTGDWVSARAHLEQGIALYDPQQHRAHAFLYGGHDPSVCCQCNSAWCLWMLGYPDQALRRSQDAVDLARELSHPTTVAHSLYLSGMLHQFRRERPETQELAEELERLSAEQGLPTYLAGGSALRGWALAEGGHGEEGRAQIRQSLAASASSASYWRPYFRVLLAEACDKGGDSEEGLAVLLAAALEAGCGYEGWSFYEPEMHTGSRENSSLAAACSERIRRTPAPPFRQAIDSPPAEREIARVAGRPELESSLPPAVQEGGSRLDAGGDLRLVHGGV